MDPVQPRGEAVVTNSNYALRAVSEVGFQPTHGSDSALDTTSTNLVAIQLTGIGGNVKIYQDDEIQAAAAPARFPSLR